MNETSHSLLAQIRQSDDSDSWNRLVELYTPLMHKWLRAYEVSDADADDLVQEVLLVVSQELPNFSHNERAGAFRSWLRKILVHRLQNHWRGKKRLNLTQSSSMSDQLNQLEDDNSGLSRVWDEQHDHDVITRLMELVQPKFQPKTWEAFRRQMFDGQKPADVATDLGMGIGSVYMARNRVLVALRTEANGLVDSFS